MLRVYNNASRYVDQGGNKVSIMNFIPLALIVHNLLILAYF